ncbi:sodium:solute symporter [Geothrix fuzhouensis]|uniref:sodium:solute symporter n=1 Tax=Geothrix fuzhouensis TaxID=2966451 RepID=UPI00214896C8|nr:sodium:solute symporter [Geothrix fuzhouensis]
MSRIDWIVLGGALLFVVLWGLYKGRGATTGEGYIGGGRDHRWWLIGLSIIATQMSAITFLSTPGLAYVDGMRFVQFYFGLPLAAIALSITVIPLYHRLKVSTAYEILENRFDLKTRLLAASLFLIQRSLAVGITIFAPALVLSVLLGWSIHANILLVGVLVMTYTVVGGTRAVAWAHTSQMVIIAFGMILAGVMTAHRLPAHVSLSDALHVAGGLGRLNAIDLKFDLNNRYNLWSGLIGGFFLMLSYFGTDQSQVQRYLAGSSVTQSRLGLLLNGMVKVPLQFLILLLGVLVFAFYQFNAPPLFFNPGPVKQVMAGPDGPAYRATEAEYAKAREVQRQRAEAFVAARHGGEAGLVAAAKQQLQQAQAESESVRQKGLAIIEKANPGTHPSDVNYIFLAYVLSSLPAGLVGLVLAAVFSGSMSSMSGEISALGATTVVDLWRRLIGGSRGVREVWVGRIATFAWGCFAMAFAEYAARLGSLIEAVNILGSLFYGTILGIFITAFYVKRARGGTAFYAALVAEVGVFACFKFTSISFLWYNVIGCLAVVGLAWAFSLFRTPDALPQSS